MVIRHFQMWFKWCSRFALMDYLHKETTFLEIEENRLNQNLGKIVCALTARYINPGSMQLPAFAEMCAEDVNRYIALNMGTFLKGKGRENLLILVTSICHFWCEDDMGKVWMYMGLAGRMITALQFNWDGAGDTPFEQESVRRAVWKVWEYDRRLAGGFEEHLVLRDEVMHLATPIHDEHIPTLIAAPPPVPGPGLRQWPLTPEPLCAYHIRLHRMRHSILSVTRNLVISPTPQPRPRLEPSEVLEAVERMQTELFQFHQSLPDSVKVTGTAGPNFRHWAASPECGSYVMLYTFFCELHIDLYRFSVPGLREEADPEILSHLPVEFVEKSKIQAVGYAVSLSRFWRSMKELVDQRPADDGTERMLTADVTLVCLPLVLSKSCPYGKGMDCLINADLDCQTVSIIQCTKVLLAARKHRLFTHLEEGSSAPLVRPEPVTDESLAALIQTNMSCLDAVAKFYPRAVEIWVSIHADDSRCLLWDDRILTIVARG